MDAPFDPTLKTLTELAPPDWLPLVKRRRRRATVVDSDIGTIISGATDKVLRVHDTPEYLLHLDFESGHFHSLLPLRLRLYNSVFEYRHRCVVLSVPVLLRPEADSPQWTGLLERGFPGEEPRSSLRYDVIRVWQLPVEQLLAGGISTLALAPISDVRENDVQRVIGRMKERLSGARAPRRARDVWAATYVLLGLRYSTELAKVLFQEVLGMEDSVTYQDIVRSGREQGLVEGRAEGARRFLYRIGEAKFRRPPDETIRAAIEGINDTSWLEALGVHVMNVDNWEELLAQSPRRRRNGRRRARE